MASYFFFCASFARFSNRLASLPHGALHALRCLRFGRCCRRTVRRGAVMLGHLHDDMARALLITEAAAHRRGTHALPSRSFVDEAGRHVERVHVERCAGVVRLALGIGDGAAQRLLDVLRHALLGEAQCLQRIFRALAANQVNHQPRLLRRNADEPRVRHALDLSLYP